MAASGAGLLPADSPVGVVGRESELATVGAFLDASSAVPAALVIEGEPGMGKTTIVRAALTRASSKGLRVFLARPSAGEMELPYAGLGDLLATVRTDALAALAGPQRAAIEAALSREGSSAAVDEPALSRGVLELLRLEGSQGDLLIAVDDVQWLDRPTVSALAFAVRRLGPVPIRVLVAMRTGDGARAKELPLGLADQVEVRRVAVGPLSTTELGVVLRQHLGERIPRPRVEALWRASGGNPMFALELARQATDERAGSPAPTLPLAIGERLRALDAHTQTALAFIAAALRPSTDQLFRAGVDRAELESALDTGIVALDGERLSFAHPLLGSAAYELVLPDERRDVHARLAAASSDAVERGHHVSRSTIVRDESAAESLDRAAKEAADLGDHGGAAGFLIRASELSLDPTGEPAHRRKGRAAVETYLAGDVEAAATIARSLVGRLPPGVARARARWTLASCLVGPRMPYEEFLAEIGLALEDAEADDVTSAQLHVEMAETYGGMGRIEQSLDHLRMAIELAERAGATAIQAVALGLVGFFECLQGRGITDSSRRALALWDGTMVPAFGYSPRMSLAEVCLYASEFAEAERLYQDEIAMADERGLEAVEVIARAHLAETQTREGTWSAALADARLAVEHARQAADAQIVTGATYSLAMIEALVGEHEVARALATEALVAAEATEDFWARVGHRSVLGLVALTEGDSQAAVEALEPAWSLMLDRGLGDLSIFPVAQVLGEALVAVGRLEDAQAVVEALQASPVGDGPWSRAMAGRCAALVASARGNHAAARSAMAGALEAHAELPEPFEHARTLQLSGRVERSARNWGAARTVLVEALERFDALGAARWAEKTAADIARLPGRRPADKHALTTREREVAELVAAGLANKEVAARLFVSLRTVEASLSKVYAKLGVRSRTELASRLDPPGGALADTGAAVPPR